MSRAHAAWVLLAVASCTRTPPRPAPEAPPALAIAPPAAVEKEVSRGADVKRALRATTSLCHVYVPEGLAAQDGAYDVVVHFHGVPGNQEVNIARAKLSAVVVSVNLGVGSSGYANTYARPQGWQRLMGQVAESVAAVPELRGAKPGRVALSAWSAGFASVKGIIDSEETASRIDAVLIADGLFTSYSDKRARTVNTRSLAGTFAFARAATKGQKLFVLSHARVPTFTYPTVEETTGTMLDALHLAKQSPGTTAPRPGLHPTYEVHEADFHVYGYEGDKAGDHIEQIRAMGQVLYPLLAQRWSR